MFKDIYNSFYDSVIYDNRYKFILEGLFNTLIQDTPWCPLRPE